MKIAAAHSADPDTDQALMDLVAQGRDAFGGEAPSAALVFACYECDHGAIGPALRREWPSIDVVGCTTDGELSSRLGFQEDSITCLFFGGEGVQVRAGVGHSASKDLAAAAREAVSAATRPGDGPVKLCVLVPESLTISGAAAVDEIAALLPAETPLVGGTAADQWAFEQTRQLYGTDVLQDSVPVLLFRGDVKVAVGVASGWTPLGRKAVVTRVDGNRVHEIDGQAALGFFRGVLGHAFHPDPEHPVAVLGDDGFYLRAPLAVEPDTGTIVFAGDIPQGAVIQISEVARDEMLDACQASIRSAAERW